MLACFDEKKEYTKNQFISPQWLEDSGYDYDKLRTKCEELEYSMTGEHRDIIKARVFEFILNNGQIALDKDDIFSDKLCGRGLIAAQKTRWLRALYKNELWDECLKVVEAQSCGAYAATPDFGHTSPNSRALLDLGLQGLIGRIENAKKRELTDGQEIFYRSCEIMLSAIIKLITRHADAIKEHDPERAECLNNIAKGAPQTTYEAMQLLIIYFFMHEYIGDTRVRTLGRLDALLYPFYKKDLESGRYTKEEIYEMLKFFLYKFWCAKVPYDIPFMLGGSDKDGKEITNELSYMIVDAYNSLDIHSPKIHIGVSDKTPKDFILKVLACIRGGNNSFVFSNDAAATEALKKVGIPEEDAKDYILIGCYELAIWGSEIGCTDNSSVNLAKAIELVLTGGYDKRTGALLGLKTKEPESFEEFFALTKAQIAHMTEAAIEYVCKLEKHYYQINPDPIHSAMYDSCVERGVDAYAGGAKYNNSTVNFMGLATLVDSLTAVKTLVYDEKRVTLEELREILFSDWENAPELMTAAKKIKCKYGNQDPYADKLTADIAKFASGLVNKRPNNRGGYFKAGLYSIDRCYTFGEGTMATPDGRRAGEPLSKNLCAVSGMDKKGITALINSVTKIDFSDYPNGAVFDIVLHPSAVSGDDGLLAMYGLLKTYFAGGGLSLHGNIFNSEKLRAAQKEPEKYSTLQVRLCGWNTYFTDLTRVQQDEFIKQTDNLG